MSKLATYAQAKALLTLVQCFSRDTQLILNPSVIPKDGWPPTPSVFDPATGVYKYAVPTNTPDDEEGAYMLYGHVEQARLVLPPSLFQPGSSDVYTLKGGVQCVFEEDVAELIEQKEKLDYMAKIGHPLGNAGIRAGKYLVPAGKVVGLDGTVSDDLVILLYWSSRPFDQPQESSAGAPAS